MGNRRDTAGSLDMGNSPDTASRLGVGKDRGSPVAVVLLDRLVRSDQVVRAAASGAAPA